MAALQTMIVGPDGLAELKRKHELITVGKNKTGDHVFKASSGLLFVVKPQPGDRYVVRVVSSKCGGC